MQILNEFIWPTLVYPFQSATLSKLPKKLLVDLDILLRSFVKEVMLLPPDTPNAVLYTSKKHKGFGLICAEWEAYLQTIGICSKLKTSFNPVLPHVRDLEGEINIIGKR